MLKAIHAQESREAADNKAQAIVDDLRASKMGKGADLVEQAVHENPDLLRSTVAQLVSATL
jgi:putative transposase